MRHCSTLIIDEDITIVELPEFIKRTKGIFNSEELEEFLEYLKDNPTKGDVIAGTNGVRKIRVAAGGKGKRGGARVIYYYQVSATTIYLLTAYTKNTKEDLTAQDKKQLKLMVESLLNAGRLLH